MTDQEYINALTTVVEETNLDNALERLTALHEECNRRTMEYWSGNRSRHSIHSRNYLAAVNTVSRKFNVEILYTRNNRYEVT